jgi:hypothetical protein
MKYILIVLIAFLSACGGKYITSEHVEYEGALDGDYRDSDVMVDKFKIVMGCMNVVEVAEPMPQPRLRVMGCEVYEGCEVNAVKCPGIDRAVRGCFAPPDLVILPAKVQPRIIEHEYIHYFCYTGFCPGVEDLDPNHLSPYFLECSGLKTQE